MLKTDKLKKWIWFGGMLCLAGIGVSAKLLHIHIFTHTDPDFHSLCAVSDGFNCETVALSPWSVFFGLPICIWGIWGYSLILGLLTMLHRHQKMKSSNFAGLFTFAVAGAVATSLWLAHISFFKIDSLCLFCMASYLINLLLAFVAFRLLKAQKTDMFSALGRDIGMLLRKPLLVLALLVLVPAPIVAAQKFVPAYWESAAWLDIASMQHGIDAAGDHWTGASKPQLTIVEFSDYQCPHCRLAHKNIRSLVARYENSVRLVHRQFPLDDACHPKVRRKFHEFGCVFAKAAECAGLQNKFWEMNDALFGTQEAVRAADVNISEIAVRLGLNRSRFSECMQQNIVQKKIDKDIHAGIEMTVTGTPTFFLEGKKFVGGVSEAALIQMLKRRDDSRSDANNPGD